MALVKRLRLQLLRLKKRNLLLPKPASGESCSPAEILALAQERQPRAEPATSEANPDAPKPAPKKVAAEKPAAAAKPIVAAEKETGSILAAARAAAKPGPMSKAEAAKTGAGRTEQRSSRGKSKTCDAGDARKATRCETESWEERCHG